MDNSNKYHSTIKSYELLLKINIERATKNVGIKSIFDITNEYLNFKNTKCTIKEMNNTIYIERNGVLIPFNNFIFKNGKILIVKNNKNIIYDSDYNELIFENDGTTKLIKIKGLNIFIRNLILTIGSFTDIGNRKFVLDKCITEMTNDSNYSDYVDYDYLTWLLLNDDYTIRENIKSIEYNIFDVKDDFNHMTENIKSIEYNIFDVRDDFNHLTELYDKKFCSVTNNCEDCGTIIYDILYEKYSYMCSFSFVKDMKEYINYRSPFENTIDRVNIADYDISSYKEGEILKYIGKIVYKNHKKLCNKSHIVSRPSDEYLEFLDLRDIEDIWLGDDVNEEKILSSEKNETCETMLCDDDIYCDIYNNLHIGCALNYFICETIFKNNGKIKSYYDFIISLYDIVFTFIITGKINYLSYKLFYFTFIYK
jgi:hypothetical protein